MKTRDFRKNFEEYGDSVIQQDKLHKENNIQDAFRLSKSYSEYNPSPCQSLFYGTLANYKAGFFKITPLSSPVEGLYHDCSRADSITGKQRSSKEIKQCKKEVFVDYVNCELEARQQSKPVKNRI